MIDCGLLRRLLAISAILVLLSAAAVLTLGRSPALAGGLVLGLVLGATPFVSWGWVASRGLSDARRRRIAVLLIAGKLAFYAGALYLLVTRAVVHPVGVLIGLTAVVGTLCAGAYVGTGRPREAA
jgi:hypothetical protein